ncbi:MULTISPECIES: CDP-diacylglycerol--serine O-phosphatidyltransferase [Bacillales]|jgi:CDP-diacylglycerol--serine O-phosphatidyltransferase|uniref:CDP-diacylglycerol--serine O-phosphatidyltransferase n=1 Tax=Brevibacillus aydinogluensis TaxID=927786 RepID=A0AA48MAZ6_9BACL|nr:MULTISPECIES: CDP-diacylglycerol--serine O-phosphatidyltransferase [Bacillales]REK67597.1 MAG: CDP-diacylglycerol--serine O-phosphatidyltransferase [Brevibacillus sp.]MBR8661390.1 CDP-diacylglycerol--serine O-phosphatidyltransferase [Brevibacillus sp. NL20B1]MDT3417644.1 CDP-diacylglycerol--serine O-phosphatidyltransferase [Brevibacillus aydinogluensis]NNV04123.1 CDP-diacylglycerol--serine O-phosphatidyltransferase [Brevibacillus sp. MCWH]UFJ62380.1 CDP-diacylglycerol--serine O-phosphatidyl
MFVKSLPNMLTISNLFLGIVAIILAFQGDQYVEYAAITVIVGMLMDGLDGRVARMLNVQSEFGKELDSLSDVITFGVAPAFIMYVVALQDLHLFGIIVTAIFPICGALRLARFNVQAGVPGYFVGLPITAAGGVLATLALYHQVFNVAMLAAGMLLLAFLMVSTIKYPNFKKVGIPKSAYWITPIIVAIVVVVAIKYPQQFPKIVFLPLAIYALYGIKKNVDLLVKKLRKKKENEEESLPFE